MNGLPTLEHLESRTILRTTVGSTILGLHVSGSDDRDEMAIAVETFDSVAGFDPFFQLTYRTAEDRAGIYKRTGRVGHRRPDSPKSLPGDLDLKVYGLRRYLQLLLQGSPTDIIPMFVPAEQCLVLTQTGRELQGLAPLLVSQETASRFRGYLSDQRARLLGTKGQKDVQRPELERKYGYDTKYAMHMLRLAFQLVELLETGSLSFPLPEPARARCQEVRAGGVLLPDVLSCVTFLEEKAEALLQQTVLPEKPDRAYIEDWMLSTYWRTWTNGFPESA